MEQRKVMSLIHPLKIQGHFLLPTQILKDSILIICKGTVVFFSKQQEIKKLQAGDVIYGKNLFLNDASPITMHASSRVSVYSLRMADLKYQIEYRQIYHIIAGNLGEVVDIQHNKDHEQELWRFNQNELEQRILIIQYFMFMIIVLLCLYIIFLNITIHFIEHKGTALPVTFGFSIICVLAILYSLKKTNTPWVATGLTLANTRISVKEALISTVPILIFLIGVKWILITTVPVLQHLPLFDLQSDINTLGGVRNFWLAIIEYPLVSVPLQELVFRGGIQGSLQLIYAGNRSMWKPIIASSILFSTVHIMISPYAAIFIFLPSLFWGWLFARHHNLFGVWISHAILGTFAFFFLGFFQILRML